MVPSSALEVNHSRMMLRGATEESLKTPSGVQVQQLSDRGESGLPVLSAVCLQQS